MFDSWRRRMERSAMGGWLYMLRCSDGAYYVGTTRADLERRVGEHNAGTFEGWTKKRRPVALVFSQSFDRIEDAIAAERQLKGWSRAKKEALIRGDFAALKRLSRSRERSGGAPGGPHPSTGSG
jgi:putative endonuclease